MYACICREVTDTAIRTAVRCKQATSLSQLKQCLGVASECGSCACFIEKLLDETLSEQPPSLQTA